MKKGERLGAILGGIVGFLALLWLAGHPSAQTTIANNAADMAGKIVMVADSATGRTVTNLFTFNRGAAVPLAVAAGSLSVDNLLNFKVVTTTATGTQHNFDPGISGNTLIRANNASTLSLTGFPAGVTGQLIAIRSVNAQVDLFHQNVGSLAANRLQNFATSGSTSVAGGSGYALYQYDGTTASWALLAHDQGAWITPTYAAGTYTANGTMTWTVEAGDVATHKFLLRGRALSMMVNLATTSVTAPLNTQLRVGLPNGFTTPGTVVNQVLGMSRNSDNGAAFVFGFPFVSGAQAYVEVYSAVVVVNWAAAVNTTAVATSFTVEIL